MKTKYIPNDLLIPRIKQFLDEGHTATFRVRGHSMRPFLQNERDKVVLAPCTQVERGDVVLAEASPGYFVLHRVIAKDGNKLRLQGDGNAFTTESCRVGDVVGIATGFVRKNSKRTDRTDGLKWRAYSWLWMRTGPLRRYLLFMCKLCGR